MSLLVKTSWKNGHAFNGEARGLKFTMDAPGEVSQNHGPSPKELVLGGICGCTGIDVVSILEKMRARLTRLDVTASAEKTAGDHPVVFASVHLTFDIEADSITTDKVLRAVTLSQTKYCGVTAMIAKGCPVTYDVRLNGAMVGSGRAEFGTATGA